MKCAMEYSAAGKVLLAGGYLILDEKYRGLVLSTPAIFRANAEYSADNGRLEDGIKVDVFSPQFLDGHWRYSVKWAFESAIPDPTICQLETRGGSNLFIYYSLCACFTLAKLGRSLNVTVVGDAPFYSYKKYLSDKGITPSLEAIASVPTGQPLDCKISNVHKTGLGSSAAFTTALVGSLLRALGLLSSDPQSSSADNSLVYRVSQIAHCLAQGKVGSGFDVATAVYGSLVYRRFPLRLISSLMSVDGSLSNELLRRAINSPDWKLDSLLARVKLPSCVFVLLGDVDGGSSTPQMVRKVLAWKENNPVKAEQVYRDLEQGNESLIEAIANPTQNQQALMKIALRQIRTGFRLLTRESGVQIEPPLQTELLDLTESMDGVIGVGIPGAGGADAIFCVVSSEEALRKVQEFWQRYEALSVCPLLTIPKV